MKTFLNNQFFKFFTFFLSLIFLNSLLSCEKDELTSLDEDLNVQVTKKAHAKSSNGFFAFHQGFNHNTAAWADQNVEGILGWCGTINLQDKKSGDVVPSAGSGYATVMWGECNTFWSEEADDMNLPIFEYGAPATQDPELWSSSWPSSGFVQELDIYLDPDMYDNGLAFIYSSSLKAQEATAFVYFAVNVVKVGDALLVDEHPVTESGWYGFNFLFDDNEGALQVRFELEDNHKVAYSAYLENDLAENLTAGYEVEDYGSGYVWFVAIAEGVALPIDEYRLRPGK
ncbi:hypothetical protein [Salinimicrobium sp. HB62]|uniref:hypothetical protein n=1 Tax=Salinimicrobium sp. HB62 TaxID=3077781 RepID=UPI002D773B33|nr:hypothetical protein [Salinimicrobium sp. HB62]